MLIRFTIIIFKCSRGYRPHKSALAFISRNPVKSRGYVNIPESASKYVLELPKMGSLTSFIRIEPLHIELLVLLFEFCQWDNFAQKKSN